MIFKNRRCIHGKVQAASWKREYDNQGLGRRWVLGKLAGGGEVGFGWMGQNQQMMQCQQEDGTDDGWMCLLVSAMIKILQNYSNRDYSV